MGFFEDVGGFIGTLIGFGLVTALGLGVLAIIKWLFIYLLS